MQTPQEPARTKIYSYCKNEDLIGPINDTFNIVMSKDIRKNVRIAADMAVGMAKMLQDRKIVYLNSYGGIDLMKQAFDMAFKTHTVAINPPVTVDDKLVFPSLPNLELYDCPIGFWNAEAFKKHMSDQTGAIVIVNSFEYAAINRGRRAKMAEDLVEMRQNLGLTFIVFSHEKKNDVRPGYPARGAIGILAGDAFSVWSLKDEYERMQEAKLAAKEAAKIEQQAAKTKAEVEKELREAKRRALHENKMLDKEEEKWHYVTDYDALRKQWAEEREREETKQRFW